MKEAKIFDFPYKKGETLLARPLESIFEHGEFEVEFIQYIESFTTKTRAGEQVLLDCAVKVKEPFTGETKETYYASSKIKRPLDNRGGFGHTKKEPLSDFSRHQKSIEDLMKGLFDRDRKSGRSDEKDPWGRE